MFEKFARIKAYIIEKAIQTTDNFLEEMREYFLLNDKEDFKMLEALQRKGSPYFKDFDTHFQEFSESREKAKVYQKHSQGTTDHMYQVLQDLDNKWKKLIQ